MSDQQQPLADLHHIKQMMERSSRFISLSGLSGIAAGICALIGAWFVQQKISCWIDGDCTLPGLLDTGGIQLLNFLLWVATLTFVAAFLLAFLFTYLRSKKSGLPLWGSTTNRLLWNTFMPIAVGAIFIVRMMQLGQFELVAPASLLFYGLALVNASKYTFGEVRYLGYGEVALGIMSLWFTGYGLYFWAMGFGVLHIIYGALMWYKHERNN